jgi:hypothetical protein
VFFTPHSKQFDTPTVAREFDDAAAAAAADADAGAL